MRIVFLAVDDEFAGELQRVVYESHPEWIVGSVISSRLIYKKSRFGGALMVLRKSGWTFLAAMIYVKMIRRVMDRGRRVLPSTLARDHGVEQFRCGNINSEDSVQRLRSWRPDLVISTNFSHYIGRTVRDSVARYGCWNLHKALLPRYRGMSPSFYALLEGAPTAGATLHVVSQQLDGGDILAQVEVPVSTTDSVYSLNRKASRAGGTPTQSIN